MGSTPAACKKRMQRPGNTGLLELITEALRKRGELWIGWDSLAPTEVNQVVEALQVHDLLREALEAGAAIAIVPRDESQPVQSIEYTRNGIGEYQAQPVGALLRPAVRAVLAAPRGVHT